VARALLQILLAVVLALGAPAAWAQPPAEPAQPPAEDPSAAPETTAAGEIEGEVDPDTADISITATVRIRELRFDAEPRTHVEFSGQPERITQDTTERENLPDKVQPGVTYRDVVVRLTIASVFAETERVVAELLGTTPAEAHAPVPPLRQSAAAPEVRP
jgi:hypothetical protein